jgi:hypothetical protein
MCYSKEVQLITAILILSFSLFYYFFYKKKYQTTKKAWLIPFLNNIILAFICIGGHQLFEFLSLVTNDQIIYKIGLIISISSMYFLLRSLEVLSNKNIYSKYSLILILFVAIHAFLVPMEFNEVSFHLEHSSAFIWAAMWMLLFIYWIVCALYILSTIKDDKSKKIIVYYLLSVSGTSFIISLIYTIWGYFQYSVNVCTQSPSIWCTFFVIQALVLPFFLSTFYLLFKRPIKEKKSSFKKTILFLLISGLVLLLLIIILPFFKCLTWKYIFS